MDNKNNQTQVSDCVSHCKNVSFYKEMNCIQVAWIDNKQAKKVKELDWSYVWKLWDVV